MSTDANEQKRKHPILFWGGLGFTVIVPLWIGLELEDPSTSWVSFLIGAFIVFMSKFDEIAEFSLGPLRARMREKIEEADAALIRLRKVAGTLTEVTLTDLMASNFMGDLPLAQKLDLHDELMEELVELDVPESDRSRIESMWRQGIGVIYNRAIIRAVRSGVRERDMTDDERVRFDALRTEMHNMIDFSKGWSGPTPVEYERYLADNEIMNDDAQEWINDYRHYLEANEIRRRDVFATQ